MSLDESWQRCPGHHGAGRHSVRYGGGAGGVMVWWWLVVIEQRWWRRLRLRLWLNWIRGRLCGRRRVRRRRCTATAATDRGHRSSYAAVMMVMMAG